LQGLVIRNTGSWYGVLADSGQVIDCKVKGNFRIRGIKSTNPVAVGDRVDICPNAEGTAFITAIHDRRNYIVRRSQNLSKQSHIIAANIDRAFLVATVSHPATSLTFIDRFLASAEAYRVPVTIVFNKIDLLESDDERRILSLLVALYENIGYQCIEASATDGTGIEALSAAIGGQVSLLSGNSGVGKSTIINAILPEAKLRTAEISDAHDSGTHTTTFSEMLTLPGGGFVIDTPGIKGFGSFDMKPEEISSYFPEIFRFSSECRFSNCTHTHEPGCAVLKALEQHYIAESRYRSYLSMMNDDGESKYREAY